MCDDDETFKQMWTLAESEHTTFHAELLKFAMKARANEDKVVRLEEQTTALEQTIQQTKSENQSNDEARKIIV